MSLLTFITAITLLTMLVAWRGIRRARHNAIAARLARLYALLAALLALRLVAGWWPTPFVAVLTMLAAAWLPLGALRLIEELCRRHAPRLLKLFVLGGAVAFSIVALAVGAIWSAATIALLAAFQALSVAAMLWLLVRSRHAASIGERNAIDIFALALLLSIPLLLTDFRALLPYATVRGGPFAVLLLLLATSRLAGGQGSPRQLAADLALLLAGGALCAGAAAIIGNVAWSGAWAAFGAAFTALVVLIERAVRRDRGPGLVAAMARLPAEVDQATLIGSHPLLAGARIIGPAELGDYPDASLRQLDAYPVLSDDIDEPDARAAASELLRTYAASHIVRLNRAPLTYLAVNAGGLAGIAFNDELALIGRWLEARNA